MQPIKPVMLMILDGWGKMPAGPSNAVSLAKTPHLDNLLNNFPSAQLKTSGPDVGLPEGIMGNSEVGHMNIGAGRIVYQDLLRIDRAIGDGSLFTNPAIAATYQQVSDTNGTLHLMGLVSDGGVHSQLSHLLALIDLASQMGLKKVCVHAILDGRDTPPHAGKQYIGTVADHVKQVGTGIIATICGRYYAMDRDNRWDRTAIAYALYTQGDGTQESDPVNAVEEAYARGETDEFIKPIVITNEDGTPHPPVQDGDCILFFNFRADRARQITRAFTQDTFDGFQRAVTPDLGGFTCLTRYDETFDLPVAFPPVQLEDILGKVLSDHGLKQLRIAETEKYAHVTYFFNGGEETPFENEDRCLVPSPRDVPTYDHKPAMSANQVTEKVLEQIASDQYDFIVLNFANMDMVGHTGIIEAAIEAVETVDACVGRIAKAILSKDGALIVTADHGNAEIMIDDEGGAHTAHTTNPVHIVLVCDTCPANGLQDGVLGDIAPTILELMGIAQPEKMTGHSLLLSS